MIAKCKLNCLSSPRLWKSDIVLLYLSLNLFLNLFNVTRYIIFKIKNPKKTEEINNNPNKNAFKSKTYTPLIKKFLIQKSFKISDLPKNFQSSGSTTNADNPRKTTRNMTICFADISNGSHRKQNNFRLL